MQREQNNKNNPLWKVAKVLGIILFALQLTIAVFGKDEIRKFLNIDPETSGKHYSQEMLVLYRVNCSEKLTKSLEINKEIENNNKKTLQILQDLDFKDGIIKLINFKYKGSLFSNKLTKERLELMQSDYKKEKLAVTYNKYLDAHMGEYKEELTNSESLLKKIEATNIRCKELAKEECLKLILEEKK